MIHIPRPAYKEQVMQWSFPVGTSTERIFNGTSMNVRTQGEISHNEIGVSIKSDNFGFLLRDPGVYSYSGNIVLESGPASRDGQVGLIIATNASNGTSYTFHASRTMDIDLDNLRMSIMLMSPDFIFTNTGGEFTFGWRHINNRELFISSPSYIEIVRHD